MRYILVVCCLFLWSCSSTYRPKQSVSEDIVEMGYSGSTQMPRHGQQRVIPDPRLQTGQKFNNSTKWGRKLNLTRP